MLPVLLMTDHLLSCVNDDIADNADNADIAHKYETSTIANHAANAVLFVILLSISIKIKLPINMLGMLVLIVMM